MKPGRNLPLLWKVFFSTSLITTLLFALIGWMVRDYALRTTTETLETEVKDTLTAYESLWRARSEYLASISKLISGLPDVRAAFGTRDRATIQDTAGEVWSRVSREDAIFLVTDHAGNVIASLSGDAALPARLESVQAVQSQFPKQGSGFVFLGERLYQVVITPVYVDSGAGAALINVLVAGFAAGEPLTRSLKQATGGSDFLLMAHGRLLGSTVPGPVAERLSRIDLAARQVRHIDEGGANYSVLSTPLSEPGGQPIGELRILRSFAVASSRIAALRLEIAAIWLIAILASLVVTFILTRRMLRPIRELDRAALEISLGNYGYRAPSAGDDEIGRLGSTFNAMCVSIQQSRDELIRQERINTVGRLASSIVHDLRNPLAAIYGGAEIMVDSDNITPAQTKRLSGNIYRASRQILNMLDDLMAVGRGKGLGAEPCQLAEIIEDAWMTTATQTDAAAIEFSMEGERKLEVPASRARVERVFVNLFSNSVEAMQGRGGVKVRLDRAGADALITVEDTGPGVPESLKQRLFQPFASSGKPNGLGLGLALSRQTLLDHGGDLWLDGAKGGGARFRLRLPFQPHVQT